MEITLKDTEKRLKKQIDKIQKETNKKIDLKLGFDFCYLYIDDKVFKFYLLRDIQNFIDGMIEALNIK